MKASGTLQRSIFKSVLLAALFLTVTLSPPAYSHGRETGPSAAASAAIAEHKNRAEELNQQLGGLIAQYKSANAAEKSSLAGQLAGLAEDRRQILGKLIENDPAEVLSQALPDDVLDQMPPQAQAFLEQHMEIEGELQLLHVDYQDDSESHYVYLLTTDNGERYSLHFAKNVADLQSGARVKAKGLVLYGIKTRDAGETEGAVVVNEDDSRLLLLEAGGPNNKGSAGTTTTTSTLPNTLGAQKTLLILVNFQDNPTQPYTSADAQNMMFGTTSDYFFENSYQQTWLSGDVAGWFTIPLGSTVCDSSSIQSYAEAAASAEGINLSAYAHRVYMFPLNDACGWAGLSSVGGNPSRSWINGNKLKLGVVAHELGHGLGLYHSHSQDCEATTLGSTCNLYEYGDTLDMMGSSFGHFNAFQKERLGWLAAGASPPVTMVVADGTYTLEPYETNGSGSKALKILKSTDPTTGQKTWYYVQFLQAIGFDGALAGNENVLNGVVIRYGTESNGNSSYFLDMTPASGSTLYYDWKDPALMVGQSFEDSAAGVSLTTEWVTATEAAVTVHFGGGVPGGQSNVGISTDKPSYNRGQTVMATALVTTGGIPVANASVSFTFTKSNGSVVTANATTGTDGVAKSTLRLRNQDPVGIYQAVGSVSMSSAAASFAVQ